MEVIDIEIMGCVIGLICFYWFYGDFGCVFKNVVDVVLGKVVYLFLGDYGDWLGCFLMG